MSKANIEYILNDIDINYSKMIKDGATTFYETIKGDKDFNNAGSVCHRWSAIPIIYYKRYKLLKRK